MGIDFWSVYKPLGFSRATVRSKMTIRNSKKMSSAAHLKYVLPINFNDH